MVQVIAQLKWQQQRSRGVAALHLLLVKEGQPEVLDIKHFTHMQKSHKLLNVKLTEQPTMNFMQTCHVNYQCCPFLILLILIYPGGRVHFYEGDFANVDN